MMIIGQDGQSRLYPLVERLFDLILALVFGILALPIALVIMIAIRLESPGPVLYRQVRIGKNFRRSNGSGAGPNGLNRRRINFYGRPFLIYKFRTMRVHAEKDTGPVWATEDDPRVTRVGSFLRKAHLDELPQLLNVIKGDMSLVGPRPERPYFVRKFAPQIEGYVERFSVKPGITGFAQLYNGYDSSAEDVKRKIAYDRAYIAQRSLRLNVRLILLTVKAIAEDAWKLFEKSPPVENNRRDHAVRSKQISLNP